MAPHYVTPPPPVLVSKAIVSWAEALSTKRVGEDLCFWPALNFGQNIGLSLSENLFFFAPHLLLGKKLD